VRLDCVPADQPVSQHSPWCQIPTAHATGSAACPACRTRPPGGKGRAAEKRQASGGAGQGRHRVPQWSDSSRAAASCRRWLIVKGSRGHCCPPHGACLQQEGLLLLGHGAPAPQLLQRVGSAGTDGVQARLEQLPPRRHPCRHGCKEVSGVLPRGQRGGGSRPPL
jgi:hypothetical protein